jgi:hypothetical protein
MWRELGLISTRYPYPHGSCHRPLHQSAVEFRAYGKQKNCRSSPPLTRDLHVILHVTRNSILSAPFLNVLPQSQPQPRSPFLVLYFCFVLCFVSFRFFSISSLGLLPLLSLVVAVHSRRALRGLRALTGLFRGRFGIAARTTYNLTWSHPPD